MRLSYLDGIRGLLALSVAASHVYGHALGWQEGQPFSGAFLAVDFFFIMSGFVLANQLANRRLSWPEFAFKRVARLWPFVVLGTAMTIAVYFNNRIVGAYVPARAFDDPLIIAGNLLFFSDLGLFGIEAIDPPAWSIGIEFWASCLLVPALFRMGARAAITLALILYLGLFTLTPNGLTVMNSIGDFLHGGVMRGVAGISLGVGMFALRSRTNSALLALPGIVRQALFAASLIFCAFGIYAEGAGRSNALFILAFLPLLCDSAWYASENILTRLLSTRVFIWLGAISFSVYLVHTPLVVLFAPKNFIPLWGEPATIAASIAMIVIVSAIFAFGFDLPVQRFFKRVIFSAFRHEVVSNNDTKHELQSAL